MTVRRWLPWAVTLAGWLGVTIWLSRTLAPAGVSIALWTALVALGAGALLLGALSLSGAAPGEAGLIEDAKAELLSGVERAYHAAIPLAALPFTPWLGPRSSGAVAMGLVLVAAALVMRLVPDETLGPRPRRRHAWYLALVGLSLCIGAYYVVLGSKVRGNWENDSAYYYGVARHIARTWRFEENIVWHFLSPPASITHAPFDYWGSLTSLLLVLPLAIFGGTHAVAAVTIALLGAASLVAFTHLLCVHLRLRNPLLEALALVMFAFTPWLVVIRVDTESIIPFQLCLLLGLLALVTNRFVWTILMAFALVLCRGEGVILGGILSAACSLKAASHPDRRRILRDIALTGASCVAVYVLWCLVSFGTPIQPGIRASSSIQRLPELHAFERARPSFVTPFHETWPERVQRFFVTIRGVALVPEQDLWLLLAVLPGVGLFRRRPAIESVIWFLFFAGATLLMWLSPRAVFNGLRSFSTLIPLVVLVGALGADAIVSALARPLRRWQMAYRLALTGAAAVLASATVPELRIYTPDARPRVMDVELATLERTLGGQAVASTHPYQIIANTTSSAITIPENGEGPMERAIRRYGVRWLVFDVRSTTWMSGSRLVLDQLGAGKRTNIGTLHLTKVHPAELRHDTTLRVLRIDDAVPAPQSEPPSGAR